MMDKQKNKYYYLKGIKNGMPICLGYLAVSFTLGITARNAGMTAWQAMLFCLQRNRRTICRFYSYRRWWHLF